ELGRPDLRIELDQLDFGVDEGARELDVLEREALNLERLRRRRARDLGNAFARGVGSALRCERRLDLGHLRAQALGRELARNLDELLPALGFAPRRLRTDRGNGDGRASEAPLCL